MKELALHILDIAENSLTAGAALVEISIIEDTAQNSLTISIKDNGKGMSAEYARAVTSPFATSRTTRRVGLGIPLFKAAAERTGGDMSLVSEEGVGTTITARFVKNHIDLQPMGDLAGTILSLVTANEHVDFIYNHSINGREFQLDTREIREILGPVPFSEADVYLWISEYLREGEQSIKSEGKIK